MAAEYPNGTKQFTTKRDRTDVNYAADVNDLQNEVMAIENELGTIPPVATGPTGIVKDYGTVQSRLAGLTKGDLNPICKLRNTNRPMNLNNQYLSISFPPPLVDNFNAYDGTALTAPATGWFLITFYAGWEPNSNGFRTALLDLNGANLRRIPATVGAYRHCWENLVVWQGLLTAGDKIRCRMYQQSNTNVKAWFIELDMALIRQYP